MADSPVNEGELSKLKLSELKKLCKRYNLPTAGVKMELVSRLIENRGENFTILQPGDEAKLLGDDVDEAVTASFSLSDTDALETLEDTAEGLTPIPVVVGMESLSSQNRRPSNSKRSHDALEDNTTAQTGTIAPSAKTPRTEAQVKEELHLIQAPPSDADRLSVRAARFGLSSSTGVSALSDEKLAARARRFGLPISETSGGLRVTPGKNESDTEAEKLRKRAERFGVVTASKTSSKLSDAERKASRLERFGPTSNLSRGATDNKAAKAVRALGFGVELDEDKLLKRKARFGAA